MTQTRIASERDVEWKRGYWLGVSMPTQMGTPHELLSRPVDEFVASLMATPKRQADQLEALAASHASRFSRASKA